MFIHVKRDLSGSLKGFICECAIVLRKTTMSKSSIQITVDSKFSELANYAEAKRLLSNDIAAHRKKSMEKPHGLDEERYFKYPDGMEDQKERVEDTLLKRLFQIRIFHSACFKIHYSNIFTRLCYV